MIAYTTGTGDTISLTSRVDLITQACGPPDQFVSQRRDGQYVKDTKVVCGLKLNLHGGRNEVLVTEE